MIVTPFVGFACDRLKGATYSLSETGSSKDASCAEFSNHTASREFSHATATPALDPKLNAANPSKSIFIVTPLLL